MNDMFGNPLAIGDIVATTFWKGGYSGGTSADLSKATVIGFSKQKVRLEYEGKKVTTKYPSQICKAFVNSPFNISLEYMKKLGMNDKEIKDVALGIYHDIISKMDY